MVAAGTALIGTCYGFARFAYGLFAPELSDEFEIGSAISGLIGAGSYVGYCIAIVVSLVLTERRGARPVAIAAGVVATLGTAVVALAPSAWVLAAGVLVAGSSTGLASPPLADAVSRWVREPVQDRAQTVVNAGTGIGVLVSGPVALLLLEQWRLAWGLFSVLAAAVTVWVAATVPSSRTPRNGRRPDEESRGPWLVAGSAILLLGSGLMGLTSVAVWTFGRDLVATVGGVGSAVSTSMWTVLGAAGIVGAFGGDLVGRVGLARSWTAALAVMAAATAALALMPGTPLVIFASAAVFGASYIILTALVLLWGTRLYPERAAVGVGIGFLMIAVGQALGAPLVGLLTDATSATVAFLGCAGLGLLGMLVRPGTAAERSPSREPVGE